MAVLRRRFVTLAAAAPFARPAAAQTRIVVASTTSTEQSGLFAHLLPAFRTATGIDVRVVALGTGQALDVGRRGDADVVFVHDQAAEERFVADGFGVTRVPVMSNDFVLVGPDDDPARIAASRRRRRRSCRAATGPARMPPSCATGSRPASTSPRSAAAGIARSARAWDRP
jgi:tungstate transport system substrate-binding protein